MENLIIQGENYKHLLTSIDAAIKESVHQSRAILIEGYWYVGQLIRQYDQGDITKLTASIALDLRLSERTLWYAISLFDTFPEMEAIFRLPEGKNISWTKLVNHYLPHKDGQPPKRHELVCPKCGFAWEV